MAKSLKAIAVALLLTFGGAGLAILAPGACAALRDRPANNILVYIMAHEDTLYSLAYSERRFERVRIGMPQTEVEDLLGVPLRVLESSRGRIKRIIDYQEQTMEISYPDLPADANNEVTELIYYYSLPALPAGATADWHVRTVAFNPNSVIKMITKDFHVD